MLPREKKHMPSKYLQMKKTSYNAHYAHMALKFPGSPYRLVLQHSKYSNLNLTTLPALVHLRYAQHLCYLHQLSTP
jgi:hypothetical protein